MDNANAHEVEHALNRHPRYHRVQYVGSGAFGSVQLCTNSRHRAPVAVKLIPRGNCVSDYVVSEIRNLRILLRPHVVKLQEVFLTDHYLGIAMEYANGGDAFDYVGKKGGLEEDEARWLFQQLAIALDYCHRKGVVNRDLKLENTLLHWNEGQERPMVKLCDFGYSKNAYTQQLSDECKSFLRNLLNADPQQRYTVRDIIADPWLAHGLPRGALEMNSRHLAREPVGQGFQTQESIEEILAQAMHDEDQTSEQY